MRDAIAVGVFDGLHLGHVEILARARARARAHQGRTIVVSFDPHPELVLKTSFQALAPLTPISEKRARLAALGIDAFELIPFTRELAALSPERFVDDHLVRPFQLRSLVVGENFALGRGRSGNVTRLREIGSERGFEVVPVPLLEFEGAPVTSTRIRACIGAGKVAEAARLLGRRYGLAGVVVSGEAIGRTLGVPTANLRLAEEKLVPRDGIYAVWARVADEQELRPAVMSIGVRPTFGGQTRTLEVHLLGWNGELLGRPLDVEFVEWIRDQERFETQGALIEAMRADIEASRRSLSESANHWQ